MAKFTDSQLRGFIARAFTSSGFPSADASTIAQMMVEADISGADAHGIFRLPQYIGRFRAGAINAQPDIQVERTGPSTARIDGDNAMGHLVMSRAAHEAVAMARETGLAWVGSRMSNHAGAAATYAAIPAEHGMVGIYSAVASANHMPPWGGIESLLGTNPLAIAIPLKDKPPVLLDIATTVVSYGTVKNHELNNKPMPDGWMVETATGQPLNDASRSNEGFLLPIGGYKGAGLALMLGLLAGTLNGAAFGKDVVDFNADKASATNTGQFILALDIARFIDPDIFAREAQRHLDAMRESKPLPGFERVRLPGDDRALRREQRLREGIEIPSPLLHKLNALAVELGIAPLA